MRELLASCLYIYSFWISREILGFSEREILSLIRNVCKIFCELSHFEEIILNKQKNLNLKKPKQQKENTWNIIIKIHLN